MPAADPSAGRRLPGARWAAQIRHFDSPVLRMRYRGGVVIGPAGMPEWDLLARAMVRLPPPDGGILADLTLDEVRVFDVLAANALMADRTDPLWTFDSGDRPARTPSGWTWAHLFGTRVVALVPAAVYGAFRHVGGVATLRAGRPGSGVRIDGASPVPTTATEQLDETLLARLEDRLGYPLPPAYRAFLAGTNGLTPTAPGVHPACGIVVDQPFFGLGRADRHQDLLHANGWFDDRLTGDFLAVGYVQGGLLAIRVRGPEAGSVWFLDDDDARADDRQDADDICANLLYRLADDLDAFWRALSVPPGGLLARVDQAVATAAVAWAPSPEMGASLPPDRSG